MANTTFVDGVITLANRIVAAWLNDVNDLRYGNNDSTRGAALLQFAGSGGAIRTTQAKLQDIAAIKDFSGVTWNGSGNDTSGVNTAIATLNAAGTVALYLNSGTGVFSGALTRITAAVSIIGAGRNSTILSIGSNSNITFLSIGPGPGNSLLDRVTIGGFKIQASGSGLIKFIEIDNMSDAVFHDIELNGAGLSASPSASAGSIGWSLLGRDVTSFTNLYTFDVPRPVVVGSTGVSGGIDHYSFYDTYFLVNNATPVYPIFEVLASAVVHNLSFSGDHAWVGGKGAFKFAGGTSTAFSLMSVRWETAGAIVADVNMVPAFIFDGSSLTNVTFVNCTINKVQTTTTALKGTHIYARNVTGLTLVGTSFVHTVVSEIANWLDADNTCDVITVEGCSGYVGGGYEVLGSSLRDISSARGPQTTPPSFRPNRKIVTKTAIGGTLAWPSMQMGDAYIQIYADIDFDPGDILPLPGYDETLSGYLIFFTDQATPSVIFGGGQAVIAGPNSTGTANNAAHKITGSANFVSGVPGGSQVGLYKDVAGTRVAIANGYAADSLRLTVLGTTTIS